MSAQPVDVLAAMDKALACFTGKARDKARVIEARVAVAELIEAVNEVDAAMGTLPYASPAFVSESVPQLRSRLRAALARCGGTP